MSVLLRRYSARQSLRLEQRHPWNAALKSTLLGVYPTKNKPNFQNPKQSLNTGLSPMQISQTENYNDYGANCFNNFTFI